eukprot:TRINITY_DN23225_c0_g1_i2.p1 TRINITY_DN23225_c0_g1~~TRINITY_DN23225_c0_g1_i2.p1  ORF type:complete len:907 (-),score=194.57 TRINITY_DN23225_c0_g1_i2:83-2803(-)
MMASSSPALPTVFLPGSGDAEAAMTTRILGLLEGITGQKDNSRRCSATTLEYRGQWQPKPNGAETGHGVVPKDWAIEVASENDRALANFGWAGGAQLCLSNAFRQAEELRAQAQDLIDSGTCTEDDAAVQCIRTIASATEEREALMRRQWCDVEFQEGEQANAELLKHLERDFASQLASTAMRQAREEDRRKCEAADSHAASRVSSGPWYSIKVSGGTKPGHIYFSAQTDGQGVELTGHDDGSGRQRWLLEQSGAENEWCNIRVLGGTTRGRRLLSRGACGRLELCELDDGSGRQRWLLLPAGSSPSEVVFLLPAVGAGDPGRGMAAEVEAKARGRRLGGDVQGYVCLQEANNTAACQHWIVRGTKGELPLGNTFVSEREESGASVSSSSASVSASRRNAARQGNEDSMVAIALRAGAQEAVSLSDLSQDEMTRALGQNRNLGTAIDLVGVYLKNYEIDKADSVCTRIEPLCRERGGVWLFKLLNFFTTVRMKQSRYTEALAMYEEYETLIGFTPDEAWELYDTVYRNFGWIYTSLHEYDMALEYFEKAVNIKRTNGVQAHWFDQWDLGKTHARLSLQRGRPENLELALKLIEEALQNHRAAEPQDTIMRCKVLNSAGECAAVRGDFCTDQVVAESWFDRAIEYHLESYNLYMQVLGPKKPLTGWCMEDLAGAYRRRGRHHESKPLLIGALKVECSKDIIKLSSMARLLDAVLEAHKASGDSEGLAQCQDAINIGLGNLQKRRVDRTEAVSYAALLEKIVKVLLAHDPDFNRDCALSLLEEALEYLNSTGTRYAKNSGDAPKFESREEERQFCIPQAGQQELDCSHADVLASVQSLLRALRRPYPVQGETEVAKGFSSHPSFVTDVPSAADFATVAACLADPVRQQSSQGLNFEIVEDSECFHRVD